MIRLFQIYFQYGEMSLASQIEFGDSVIPNVFTVWCISLAFQEEFVDSVIANVFTVVYFFCFPGRVC